MIAADAGETAHARARAHPFVNRTSQLQLRRSARHQAGPPPPTPGRWHDAVPGRYDGDTVRGRTAAVRFCAVTEHATEGSRVWDSD